MASSKESPAISILMPSKKCTMLMQNTSSLARRHKDSSTAQCRQRMCSSIQMKYPITPCGMSSKQRGSSFQTQEIKDIMSSASHTTAPSHPVKEQQKTDGSSQLWTWNLTTPALSTHPAIAAVEASSTPPETRSESHTLAEVLSSNKAPHSSLTSEPGSLTKPLVTTVEGQGGSPPASKELGNISKPIKEKGRVKKMVEKIEKVATNAPIPQPSSLYVSVARPLEVWMAPDLHKHASPTIFYIVPQTQPYNVLPDFADNKTIEEEEIQPTLKTEPRMVPLLEKAGIELRQDQRLPPPPSTCEEWWSQSERIIKKGNASRTKRDLGYYMIESSDSGEEEMYGPKWQAPVTPRMRLMIGNMNCGVTPPPMRKILSVYILSLLKLTHFVQLLMQNRAAKKKISFQPCIWQWRLLMGKC